MSVCLSSERRRTRNFKVLCCIHRLCANGFALNIRVAVRWIPSECNVSDEPSREYDPTYKGPHDVITHDRSHLGSTPPSVVTADNGAQAMSDLGCAAASSDKERSAADTPQDLGSPAAEQDTISEASFFSAAETLSSERPGAEAEAECVGPDARPGVGGARV